MSALMFAERAIDPQAFRHELLLLLGSLFDVAGLRRLVRQLPQARALDDALPGDSASKGQFVADLVDALVRLGSHGSDVLWVYIEHERPLDAEAIAAARRRCQQQVATPRTDSESCVLLLGADVGVQPWRDLAGELARAGLRLCGSGDVRAPHLASVEMCLVVPPASRSTDLIEQVCCMLCERRPLWTLNRDDAALDAQLAYLLSLAPHSSLADISGDRIAGTIRGASPGLHQPVTLAADDWSRLVDALAELWPGSRRLRDLAVALDLPEPPRGAHGRGGVHWLLLALLDLRSEVALRRLALAVRQAAGGASVLAALRAVAVCLRQPDLPDELELIGCWVRPGAGGLDVEVFCPRGEPGESALSARTRDIVGTTRLVLGASLTLDVEVLGCQVSVRIHGNPAQPLIGAGLRVWSGLRTIAGALVPAWTDRMGDASPDVLLFSGQIEIGDFECDD